MSESEMKVIENNMVKYADAVHADLEARIIALERGLEGVLRRLEASSSPDDQAGWFGRPE